jgi:hypothetical protein
MLSEVANTANLLGNPDSSGPVWWRNASLPTELMGHRACGYRLRSGSCSDLAGGRGTLPSSPLRLRVDGLCCLLRAAVARRRLYPCPADGASGLVTGPTEPELSIVAPVLCEAQFSSLRLVKIVHLHHVPVL